MKWNTSVRLSPSRWDLLPLAAVLLLAGGLAMSLYAPAPEDALTAVVRHGGEEVARFALAEAPQSLEIDGQYHLTLCFDEEGVWVARSDCPTQDCLHTGKITCSGSSIVCLPEQLVVVLEGETADGVDAVLG